MATININTELFKRYAPKKKLEIIEKLTPAELMNVTTATLTRIVKEAGENMWKSRDKRVVISCDRRRGNSWNSKVEAIELYKGILYLNFYVQYENTDTNQSQLYSSFIQRGDYRVEVKTQDRYGNPRTYYAIYDEGDKHRVIRSILEEYVYTKYKLK